MSELVVTALYGNLLQWDIFKWLSIKSMNYMKVAERPKCKILTIDGQRIHTKVSDRYGKTKQYTIHKVLWNPYGMSQYVVI